jgi:hypothetical protein
LVGLVAAYFWFRSASVHIPLAPGAAIGGTLADNPFNVALRDAAIWNFRAALTTAISVFLLVVAEGLSAVAELWPVARQPPNVSGQKVLRSDESAHWHWEEGNKYVIEGGKSLFWLNGAAAIAMLTFLGNTKEPITGELRVAVALFAFGSLSATFLFMCAYVAQLNYGKHDLSPAGRWHNGSYVFATLGVVLFAIGVVVAALNL